MTTKIFQIDGFLNFLRYGAPPAGAPLKDRSAIRACEFTATGFEHLLVYVCNYSDNVHKNAFI